MFDLVTEKVLMLYQQFKYLSTANPIVAGAVSLWGLGVLTYICKDIPTRIWGFLKRQFTTTLVVQSSDAIYHQLLAWISEKKMNSFVRTLSLKGRWEGSNAKWSHVAMGYGGHWFMHGGKLIHMSRSLDSNNHTEKSKEALYLTMFGRSHKLFNDLFRAVLKEDEEDKRMRIWRWDDSYWTELARQSKRPLETVALPKETKDTVLTHLKSFWADKEWYMNAGVPWRTGILLYGPPGTGKTSFIKALAAHFDRDIYLLDLSAISDKQLLIALNEVSSRGIVVIEDIDTAGIEARKLDQEALKDAVGEEAPATPDDDSKKPLISLGPTLSGVLNAIDGPASAEGRIIIATSNNPDSLDPALVREGRFDLKVRIGHMTNETFRSYVSRLYGQVPDLEAYDIKDGTAPCQVQKLIFENRTNPQPVLDAVAIRRDTLERVS
jgi:chaperone BCS1